MLSNISKPIFDPMNIWKDFKFALNCIPHHSTHIFVSDSIHFVLLSNFTLWKRMPKFLFGKVVCCFRVQLHSYYSCFDHLYLHFYYTFDAASILVWAREGHKNAVRETNFTGYCNENGTILHAKFFHFRFSHFLDCSSFHWIPFCHLYICWFCLFSLIVCYSSL